MSLLPAPGIFTYSDAVEPDEDAEHSRPSSPDPDSMAGVGEEQSPRQTAPLFRSREGSPSVSVAAPFTPLRRRRERSISTDGDSTDSHPRKRVRTSEEDLQRAVEKYKLDVEATAALREFAESDEPVQRLYLAAELRSLSFVLESKAVGDDFDFALSTSFRENVRSIYLTALLSPRMHFSSNLVERMEVLLEGRPGLFGVRSTALQNPNVLKISMKEAHDAMRDVRYRLKMMVESGRKEALNIPTLARLISRGFGIGALKINFHQLAYMRAAETELATSANSKSSVPATPNTATPSTPTSNPPSPTSTPPAAAKKPRKTSPDLYDFLDTALQAWYDSHHHYLPTELEAAWIRQLQRASERDALAYTNGKKTLRLIPMKALNTEVWETCTPSGRQSEIEKLFMVRPEEWTVSENASTASTTAQVSSSVS